MTDLVPTQSLLDRRASVALVPRPSVFAARLGLAGIACSLLFMVEVTVAGWDRMSPLDTTMSDYVFVPGVGWMFDAAVLCMCVAGFGAMAGLARIRLLGRGLVRLALALAVFGSLLAAIFRTDLGESVSVSAQIHRYAAGVVFFCVPVAAFLLARQLVGVGYLAGHRKWLSGNAIVTFAMVGVFIASHFAGAVRDLNGLIQRVVYVQELALFAQIVVLPLRFRLPATR